jgi:hypothetical protein
VYWNIFVGSRSQSPANDTPGTGIPLITDAGCKKITFVLCGHDADKCGDGQEMQSDKNRQRGLLKNALLW